MKRLSSILIIITYIVSVNAQDYRQFPKSSENPLWVIKTTYPYIEDNNDIHCDYMGMIGDTLINSNEYNKIYYLNDTICDAYYISNYYGALREESKKIFFIDANEHKEKLVFDFSKNINDTILFDSTRIPPEPIILDNIDTILLNGSNYIRYSTQCGDQWIEGIGNTEWSTFNTCPPIPDNGSYTRLSCFKLNDTIIYGQDCKCYNIVTGINEVVTDNPLMFFPNPASDFVTLNLPSFEKRGSCNLEIINIYGKVIFNDIYSTDGDKILSLEKFNNGIYIVRFLIDEKIYTNKLIINKR